MHLLLDQRTVVRSNRLRRVVALAAGLGASMLAMAYAVHVLHAGRRQFDFDDAYMFYRYAVQLRHGHGISWNAGGPPAYGLTSMAWFGVILLFSFLPLPMTEAVTLASWSTGLLALVAMAWFVSSRATTAVLRSFLILFPLLTLAFLFNPHFAAVMVNGMETMLAVLVDGLLCYRLVCFFEAPSTGAASWLAVVAFLATLTRPDLALCAAAIPLLGWQLLLRRSKGGQLLVFYALYAALLAADLLACHVYFGSALPLSFYMKSRHAYQGYAKFWNWPEYLSMFLGIVAPALIALAFVIRRSQLAFLATFLVPVGLTFVYLATVTQIMGTDGRYYMPYVPFVILPALWLLDQACRSQKPALLESPMLRAAVVCLLFLYPVEYPRLSFPLSQRISTYPPPVFYTAAEHPLPQAAWIESVQSFARSVAKPLPPGATIAASEVGLVGAEAPEVAVIDLMGLNDTGIALHGFSVTELLNRLPDAIWLPHTDYTFQYGMLASDPRLLRDYTVLAGAFNYGIAVRRASPLYPGIMASLRDTWGKLYPGTRLEDYIATRITWSQGPMLHGQPALAPRVVSLGAPGAAPGEALGERQ